MDSPSALIIEDDEGASITFAKALEEARFEGDNHNRRRRSCTAGRRRRTRCWSVRQVGKPSGCIAVHHIPGRRMCTHEAHASG